jgi:predicted nucleic acid-binding protein
VILYAESSAVLRWLFNDPLADQVFDDLVRATKVVSSRLTLVECRRAARRALSESRIAEAQLSEVLSVLAQSTARWAVLELTPDVAERAGGRFPLEPVRTLDAIHLASMAVLRESLPDLVVLSTDERVRKNSAQLGFEVRPVSLAV